MKNEIQNLKDQIAILSNKVKDLEELKEEVNPYYWVPKPGETYYFHGIVNSGTVDSQIYNSNNDNTKVDKLRISMGNCYKTPELCKLAIEGKIYEQSMKIEMYDIWVKEGEPNINSYAIVLDLVKNEVDCVICIRHNRKFRFTNKETAKSFLDKHKENIIKYNIEL
jgi:hypothetical protein